MKNPVDEKEKARRYYEETRDYYDKELQYLYKEGEAFAEKHEDRASYLHLKDRRRRDPYVDTLFQGFAFLTGRIHQRLDDAIPEFTRPLLGLLWPHFLRPIPSLSILEFQPVRGNVSETRRIKRGTTVDSNTENRVLCRFQTCYDVLIQPLTLENVFLKRSSSDASVITFQFRLWDGIEYQNLDLKSLRLFIHADAVTASELHFDLTCNVKEVRLKADNSSAVLPGRTGIQAVGFSQAESLFPYPDYSFPGYRLLLEYFAFRDKFFFVDLTGFDQLDRNTTFIELEVSLSLSFPERKRFTTDNFRLHCTPIVNLFQESARSIDLNHRSDEYEVIANRNSEGVEIYSVDEVEGIVSGISDRHRYVPFYSFQHLNGADGSGKSSYYYLNTRPDADGRLKTYLSFVSEPEVEMATENRFLREETIALSVTCTNGNLANELKVGSISNHPGGEKGAPEWTRFRNLTQPILPINPPLGDGFEWRLISHMVLNTLSLIDARNLQGIIGLYDWTDDKANQLRIQGIQSVSCEPREMFSRGLVYRGIEVKIEVRTDHFEENLGDLHLFGLVLKEFLSMYASINSNIQLTFLRYPDKKRLFTWTSKQGKSFPI